MTEATEPVRWDRTIYRGTDHSWQLRRVRDDGSPLIPTEARAQARSRAGGDLWFDAAPGGTEARTEIDAVDGWVTVVIPESTTAGAEWDSRKDGVWDVEVVVDGLKYRWAMGRVKVSQDVTRES